MASDIFVDADESDIIIIIQSDDEDVEEFQGNSNHATFDLNIPAVEADFDLNIPSTQGNFSEQGDYEQPLFDLNIPPSSVEEEEQGHIYLNANTTNEAATSSHPQRRLSNMDRLKILLWLLDKKVHGVLKHGSINVAAAHFGVHRKTISLIWNKAKAKRAAMQSYNIDNMYHQCGRKRIQFPQERFMQLSLGQRTCLRDLAAMLGLGVTTMWKMIKRGFIEPHTNPLHPGLKESNKVARLKWVLNMLIGDSAHTKSKYHPMYDYVHLDEKWFFLTQKSQRVYIEANVKPCYRAASSSTNIPKVMFTAVVGRPRFGTNGECDFNGKIGIFPFTYQEPAKRTSKNRQRGTMVTKLVKSVNKNVTRHMLIHQIIPAIKEKWPAQEGTKTIFIQQDNAKAHITQSDPEWQRHCQQDGFNFVLVQQLPNSPDLNILDLGFFRSIQSLMHKKMPKDEDELLKAVSEAFEELAPKTLSNVWISLQYVMNEILKAKGGNDYDLPHINKQRLEAAGLLPQQVQVNRWFVEECFNLVEAYENTPSTSR